MLSSGQSYEYLFFSYGGGTTGVAGKALNRAVIRNGSNNLRAGRSSIGNGKVGVLCSMSYESYFSEIIIYMSF